MDEYLTPLREECLPDVLQDYEAHGGLSVSNAKFNDAAAMLSRGARRTAFEATNYTLGVPHPLLKPICYSAHSKGPARSMHHCCVYKEGFHAVDENFEPILNTKGAPCWDQPPGKGGAAGTSPRSRIQLSHFQVWVGGGEGAGAGG